MWYQKWHRKFLKCIMNINYFDYKEYKIVFEEEHTNQKRSIFNNRNFKRKKL